MFRTLLQYQAFCAVSPCRCRGNDWYSWSRPCCRNKERPWWQRSRNGLLVVKASRSKESRLTQVSCWTLWSCTVGKSGQRHRQKERMPVRVHRVRVRVGVHLGAHAGAREKHHRPCWAARRSWNANRLSLSFVLWLSRGPEGSAEGSASSSRWMVPVFPRPDVMEKPVEQLGPGTEIEVVARFLSRRDGRVYLRLKAATGWVSTRSCEDMALVVLTPKAGEDPLEPAKFRTWPLKSPAMEVLPQVWPESSDAENAMLQGASNDAQNMGSQGKGQSQDTEDVTEEIEEIGNDRNEPNPTEGSEESQGSEDSEEAEEAESSEGSAQDHEDLDLETLEENVQGDNETAKASKSSKRLVRKFRIISGRLPVLRKPGMSHLLQSGLKDLYRRGKLPSRWCVLGQGWAKSIPQNDTWPWGGSASDPRTTCGV